MGDGLVSGSAAPTAGLPPSPEGGQSTPMDTLQRVLYGPPPPPPQPTLPAEAAPGTAAGGPPQPVRPPKPEMFGMDPGTLLTLGGLALSARTAWGSPWGQFGRSLVGAGIGHMLNEPYRQYEVRMKERQQVADWMLKRQDMRPAEPGEEPDEYVQVGDKMVSFKRRSKFDAGTAGSLMARANRGELPADPEEIKAIINQMPEESHRIWLMEQLPRLYEVNEKAKVLNEEKAARKATAAQVMRMAESGPNGKPLLTRDQAAFLAQQAEAGRDVSAAVWDLAKRNGADPMQVAANLKSLQQTMGSRYQVGATISAAGEPTYTIVSEKPTVAERQAAASQEYARRTGLRLKSQLADPKGPFAALSQNERTAVSHILDQAIELGDLNAVNAVLKTIGLSEEAGLDPKFGKWRDKEVTELDKFLTRYSDAASKALTDADRAQWQTKYYQTLAIAAGVDVDGARQHQFMAEMNDLRRTNPDLADQYLKAFYETRKRVLMQWGLAEEVEAPPESLGVAGAPQRVPGQRQFRMKR